VDAKQSCALALRRHRGYLLFGNAPPLFALQQTKKKGTLGRFPGTDENLDSAHIQSLYQALGEYFDMSEEIAAFFSNLSQTEWAGGMLGTWLLACGAALVLFLALRLSVRFVKHRLAAVATRTGTSLDDVLVEIIGSTRWWWLAALALFAGGQIPELSPRLQTLLHGLLVIASILQAGMWITAALNATLKRYRRQQLQKDPAGVTAVNAIGLFAKALLWLGVALLILDNLGYDVTALIAGLGVGGVAVALAVQNILGDLFASLSILIDKPFVVGDFLIVDDYLGSVEHVGLKTTRLRSLSGEQLIFSNSDLLKSRLRNYGRMYERRVAFTLGVTYQTPRERLREIPQILREAIETQPQTRFDRSHFAKYGDFSLDFETVYYVLAADYNLYMDIQQNINLQVHERFEELGIDFAYPTQTLFLRRDSRGDECAHAGAVDRE